MVGSSALAACRRLKAPRVREGDEVIALAPGSTLDPVVFVSEDGTAYTQRIHDIPASTGYGEPIVKFFKIADQTRVISALTTDPRFIGHHTEKDGPWLLVATSAGMVVRTAFEPFCALQHQGGAKMRPPRRG